MIDNEKFLTIIASTPLVSIDLIIQNHHKEILLGKRVNRPAQNYWFVPGGRIRKNESLADAMQRIAFTELNTSIVISDTKLVGAYEHIYVDNYLDAKDINTHYVVLAYTFSTQEDLTSFTEEQHSDFKWWPKVDLLASGEVHQNTKNYFITT